MSVHTYLIDKHFLSTFLNEDTDELSEEFVNLTLKEDIELSDISDFLVRMEGANIDDITKASYIARLSRVYNSKLIDSTNEAVEIFNEYAGNAKQNKVLVDLMKEMEKNLQEYYDDTMVGLKALDKIVELYVAEAKKKNMDVKALAHKVKGIYDKIDKEFTAADGRKHTYGATFTALKNICKKFGIKFSDVAMEDKKAFDVKLKKAHAKMANNPTVRSWLASEPGKGAKRIKELNDAIDELRIEDRELIISMTRNYIQPVYNYMYICMTGYMGNINYLRRILGLEREDTIFYKAINKIFKTKKSDRNKD